jgi:membrane-bound lytic murein transglycosylase A
MIPTQTFMEESVNFAWMRNSAATTLILSFAILSGCKTQQPPAPAINFNQELPAGQMALRKISPGEYPDFSHQIRDLAALRQSVQNNLAYLNAPSSRQFYPYLDISHERAVATQQALLKLLDTPQALSGGGWNRAIADNFEVYKSIGAPNPTGGYTGRVLFTGYFTPIYDASLTRQGPYQYPLYKRPADLVTDPANPEIAQRKTPDGQLVPYYTRSEIEGPDHPLAGQELVWLKSRWETYVITVQGSARLRLTDGKIYEIGYAGLNGYPYTSPGQQMIADGVIRKDQLSNKTLQSYFQSHPQAMDHYLSLNRRYVFFTERTGGPFGALNVPVTPFASIATDKAVYPRAMPAFLSVPVPINELGQTQLFKGFMMDQDRGGAIRAAGRCDIYMGVGEQAGRIAGHQLHEGELYYIAIRPDRMDQFASPPPVALRASK